MRMTVIHHDAQSAVGGREPWTVLEDGYICAEMAKTMKT